MNKKEFLNEEKEIVEKLESPRTIAKELGVNFSLDKTIKKTSSSRAIAITIALVLLNSIFILGPAIGLVGILFGGWIAGFGLMLAPILQGISLMFGSTDYYLFEIFISIACSGLGIFLLIGMYRLSEVVKIGFKKYYRWNISVVNGGMNHAKKIN